MSTNRFTPRFCISLGGLLCFGFASLAMGATYSCVPTSGSPAITAADFGSVLVSDPTQNTAGTIFPNAASWNAGSAQSVTCDCSPDEVLKRYFSIKSPLSVTSTDGDRTFYQVNTYLDVAPKVYLGGGVGDYIYMPWDYRWNGASANKTSACGGIDAKVDTGTKGQLDLRISKSFIGQSFFNNIHLFDIYVSESDTAPLTLPYMSIYMSGNVTVPQNCTINAGTQLVVDMGSFYEGDFKNIGQKPEHFTPKTFNVPIQCNDVSASANLTLRIQGTPSTGVPNALQSDNSDVGVVITDSNGNALIPNDSTSVIPLQMDDTLNTNVTLHAYPVGTTGNSPAVGQFTTLAYLRVDFS